MNNEEILTYLDNLPLKLLNSLAAYYQEEDFLSPDDVYELNQNIKTSREKLAALIVEKNDTQTYEKIKKISASIKQVEKGWEIIGGP